MLGFEAMGKDRMMIEGMETHRINNWDMSFYSVECHNIENK